MLAADRGPNAPRRTAPSWAAVPAALAGEILPSIRAVPIVEDGLVIGATRGGDGTGQQDHGCAEAGAAAAGAHAMSIDGRAGSGA